MLCIYRLCIFDTFGKERLECKILPASIVQGSVFLSIQLIDFLFLEEVTQALGEAGKVSISGTLMKVDYL